MKHDEDAGDDLLAGIDLQTWQVPPPVAAHRPAILVRALAPATPQKRRSIGWMIAGAVGLNAAVIAILLVVLRPPAPAPVVLPAGGGTVDASVQELLRKLQVERAEIERRLAEIKELQALIEELSKKVREYEERDRMRTVPNPKQPKQPDRQQVPEPSPPPDSVRDPFSDRGGAPSGGGSCDEVSCVLQNYENGCCDKFKKGGAPPPRPANALPAYLDRTAISNGIASVKGAVNACSAVSKVRGKVKVKVSVAASGLVTNVNVEAAPDAALGGCVAGAVQRAVFPKTQQGGSFSYPFVFTSP